MYDVEPNLGINLDQSDASRIRATSWRYSSSSEDIKGDNANC